MAFYAQVELSSTKNEQQWLKNLQVALCQLTLPFIRIPVEKVNQSFVRIDQLLEKVVQKQRDLKESNNLLEKKIERQKGLLKEKDDEIDSLKNKIKILSMAKNLGGSEGSENSRELKLKINEILREVDKCIGMLNQ